jgi:hypothetical protein
MQIDIEVIRDKANACRDNLKEPKLHGDTTDNMYNLGYAHALEWVLCECEKEERTDE